MHIICSICHHMTNLFRRLFALKFDASRVINCKLQLLAILRLISVRIWYPGYLKHWNVVLSSISENFHRPSDLKYRYLNGISSLILPKKMVVTPVLAMLTCQPELEFPISDCTIFEMLCLTDLYSIRDSWTDRPNCLAQTWTDIRKQSISF